MDATRVPAVDGISARSTRCVNTFTVSAPLGQPFGSSGPATYVGLPVIGFAAQSFFNGTLNVENKLVQSTYGGNFVQKGTRLIETEAGRSTMTVAARLL